MIIDAGSPLRTCEDDNIIDYFLDSCFHRNDKSGQPHGVAPTQACPPVIGQGSGSSVMQEFLHFLFPCVWQIGLFGDPFLRQRKKGRPCYSRG